MRKKTLLSLLSGVLLALAMPGFGVYWLVFVCLVPLFFALDRQNGFWPGLCFGLAFFLIDLRWIVTLARFHPIVIIGYVVLAIYFAIGCGLLGAALTWPKLSRKLTWLLLAPALFVLAEFLRTLGPLGLGFSTLYSALYRIPVLIQSAAVFGSLFITAVIVAINGSLFLFLRKRDARFVVIAIGCLALLAVFALIPLPIQKGEPLRVAVVSSKVRQEEKLDGRNLAQLTSRYLQLGEVALESDPDLNVFPESILPSYILQNETLIQSFADLARRGNTQVMLGTGVYQDRNIYNAVALFAETGEVAGTYYMVRPVPFGEYIPGRRLLEAIGLGTWAKSFLPIDLSRGDGYAPLSHFGTPICFESTLAAPARQLARNGAQMLVTPTNDAWFNESSELKAHFACAVFRAVENRRWTVQSANGGISGLISPNGVIVASLNGEGVVSEDAFLQTALSLYTRFGDWVVLMLAGALVAVILICRLIARKKCGGKIA
ncbi:apolipoprotein N-acyltransferase [Candidatus Bipolaricaulota bacterium]|nr:apolipoprotein N-acyltransferase [Candidatus Bipolaricaulota bacterium]